MNKKLLVVVDRLLNYSETFVISQALFLKTYNVRFLGFRAVKNGLSLQGFDHEYVNCGTPLGYLLEYLWKKYLIVFRLGLLARQSEIIHAHFGVGGVLCIPIKSRLDIPLVVTFHGFDITVKDEFAQKSYLAHRTYLKNKKRLMVEGDLFIAVSKFIERKLISAGFPVEKIVTHYIGIDTDFFENDCCVERKNRVLFVGRLVEKKGCENLLRAMAIVKQVRPDIELIVVGSGPEEAKLKILSRELGLEKIDFVGVKSKFEVKALMQSSKIFCVPSIQAANGDSEAFGMVFAEAQAMGVPVVSHVHGGIPEVVLDGRTGLLVEEGDTAGLAASILMLFENPSIWLEFSEAAIKHVNEKFDIRKQSEILEDIYARALGDYR